MKNKIFSIILAIVLSLPISVWAADNTALIEPNVTVNQLDENIKENTAADYKRPISKRKIAKKFLKAMAGVAVSSCTIFFILTVYNRFRERYIEQIRTPEGETSLETPENLESAVKTFLEKTMWG